MFRRSGFSDVGLLRETVYVVTKRITNYSAILFQCDNIWYFLAVDARLSSGSRARYATVYNTYIMRNSTEFSTLRTEILKTSCHPYGETCPNRRLAWQTAALFATWSDRGPIKVLWTLSDPPSSIITSNFQIREGRMTMGFLNNRFSSINIIHFRIPFLSLFLRSSLSFVLSIVYSRNESSSPSTIIFRRPYWLSLPASAIMPPKATLRNLNKPLFILRCES